MKDDLKKIQDKNNFPNYSLKHINKIRKELGLSEIKGGIIKCNNCDKEFKSYNLKLNRTCPKCKESDERKMVYYSPCPILIMENN